MAGAQTLSRTYGDVLSMTLDTEFDQGMIHDQIFNGFPLMSDLRDRVKMKDGGAKIGVNVQYGKNSTAGSYRDLDNLNNRRQATHTKVWYDWKQAAVSIIISGLEMRTNSGKSELFDLYDERVDNALMSLDDALNTMFWADGSGNGYKDLLGLAAIVSSTPTTGTLAGVNRANDTWWRNKQRTGGSFEAQGIADLRALRVSCSNNVKRGQPTHHYTTPDIYNMYESILEPRERFTKSGKGAFKGGDVAWEDGSLTFHGSPVRWDDAATAGNWYMLNLNFMSLVIHSDANFRPTDRIPMHDQDAWVVHVLFMGELVCSAPRFFGVLTSIVA